MHSENGTGDTPSSSGEGPDSNSGPVKAPARSSGRRTHRACDRCRVKKSKCNGQQPCNTCRANERTCVFSALRRRDIRKWHCHMQDTVDEAIQRLYRACKESSSFPGVLPDEKNGYVSTESILQAMGFTNLELGPRAGVPPVGNGSSLPQIQHQFANISYGPLSPNTAHASPDRQSPSNGSSEVSRPDPRAYPGVPAHQLHASFEMASAAHLPHQPHPAGSMEAARGMAEQFQDATGRQRSHGGFDYPHHYFRPPPQHQLPSSSQHVTHFTQNDPLDIVHHTPDTVQSMHDHARSNLPWELRERYPPQAESFYNGEHFINPAQVWSEYHDYTTVTQ